VVEPLGAIATSCHQSPTGAKWPPETPRKPSNASKDWIKGIGHQRETGLRVANGGGEWW